jgi:hypothetical protein
MHGDTTDGGVTRRILVGPGRGGDGTGGKHLHLPPAELHQVLHERAQPVLGPPHDL